MSAEPFMPGSSREDIVALVASSTAALPRVTDEQRMQVVEQVQVCYKSRSCMEVEKSKTLLKDEFQIRVHLRDEITTVSHACRQV